MVSSASPGLTSAALVSGHGPPWGITRAHVSPGAGESGHRMWAPPPRGHPPPYQPYTTHVAVPPYPSPPYAPPQSGIIAHYPPCGVMPHARQMLHASPHMAVPPPLHTLVPHLPLGLPMPPSAHSAHSPGMPHSPHVPNSGGRGRGSGKGGSGKDTPGKGVKGRGGSGKGKGRSGGDGGTFGPRMCRLPAGGGGDGK